MGIVGAPLTTPAVDQPNSILQKRLTCLSLLMAKKMREYNAHTAEGLVCMAKLSQQRKDRITK